MIVKTHLSRHNRRAMQLRIVGRLCQTLIRSRSAFHRTEPRGRERHRPEAHLGEKAGANESNALQRRRSHRAFTLIELLVVIAIIAVLIGLLFPAFRAVQNQAKQTQAKNDLTQIVNAVNAYYTDYGKYPLVTNDNPISPDNSGLMYTLRADSTNANGNPNANNATNPRVIVFISPPYVKNDTANNRRSGVSNTDGRYYDPWGTPYAIKIDGNYDNQLPNPYSLNAGPATLGIGVIAWSFGTDGQSASVPGPAADKNATANADDVISWQ
jgi:prepilin-type N-terminal cleavage/methylation domain-containing protein